MGPGNAGAYRQGRMMSSVIPHRGCAGATRQSVTVSAKRSFKFRHERYIDVPGSSTFFLRQCTCRRPGYRRVGSCLPQQHGERARRSGGKPERGAGAVAAPITALEDHVRKPILSNGAPIQTNCFASAETSRQFTPWTLMRPRLIHSRHTVHGWGNRKVIGLYG